MPKQRQTCTECSMRRQKCDRNLPCGRCVKRGEGDKCTRDWPEEGYDPKKHRTYPRSEKNGRKSPESDRDEAIDAGDDIRTRSTASPLPTSSTTHHSPFSDAAAKSSEISQPVASDRKPTLSFITWGTTPLENFKIPAIEVHNELANPLLDPTVEWNFSNGFGSLTNAQTTFLQMLLPSPHQIRELVEYHMSNLIWCHGTIHAPTFRAELREFSSGVAGLQLRNLDMKWAALLFAVMAGSIGCAKVSTTSSWGFRKDEKARLTRQWFKASLACLNLADYMWKHHIYSLQTICTLSVSGHLMGFSNTQTTLMTAAIKMAQGLGLQRLGPEETPSNIPSNRERLIRVETSRRVWLQICVQDWFSIPFSDMYSIQKHHFSTIPPSNYDDYTMQLLSDDSPTVISYLGPLQALGRIMSDCHDAVLTSSTELAKYEAVTEYEAKINVWRDNLPPCVHPHGPTNPSWPVWAPWIRRSLQICYSHKIMMIHRHFLGRSFTDPAFANTRRSCISAAKNILEQTKISLESDAPVFWIDHAFMVAAGITLCLDIFHRKATDREFDAHRKLVERSINILSKFDDSMIAARGVRLLSSLLTEQARAIATQSLDNYNRSKRMRESENEKQTNSTSNPVPFGHGSEPTKGRNKRAKQKFDIPRFVERLGHNHGDVFNSSRNAQAHGGNNIVLDQGSRLEDNVTAPSSASKVFSPTNSAHPLHPQFESQLPQNAQDKTQTHFTEPISSTRISGIVNKNTNNDSQPHRPFQPQTTQEAQYFDNLNGTSGKDTTMDSNSESQYQSMDLGYETFEQFFPPQTGMSNNFLFEDLLNFDF